MATKKQKAAARKRREQHAEEAKLRKNEVEEQVEAADEADTVAETTAESTDADTDKVADAAADAPKKGPLGKDKKAKAEKPAKPKLSKAQKKAKRKARVSRTGLIIAVAIGCAAMVLSVCGIACSGILNSTSDSSTSSYKLTGGVAATVDGTNITEDTITKQIMSTRTSGGYNKDKSWAQYLVDQGYTPKSLRKQLINSYAQQYLMEKYENEYGVEVTDEEVEAQWKSTCKSYGGKKTFVNMLKMYGYTKKTYKNTIKSNLAESKLKDAVAPTKKPSDKKVLKYLNKNLDTYNDARKSSHILIKVDSDASDEDKETAKNKAQECLDKINSGELTFKKAVKEYSEDTGSAKKGGNVGWDKLTSFVDEYQNALNELSEGQMSGIVESSYGYHIIVCTGYFHVDDKATDINSVPKAIKKYLANIVKTNAQTTAYDKWYKKNITNADIKINKMPSDVPYNVSLKGITASSSDDSSSTDDSTTTEETTDESTDTATDTAATEETTEGSSSDESTEATE